jgi:hypothetical protein
MKGDDPRGPHSSAWPAMQLLTMRVAGDAGSNAHQNGLAGAMRSCPWHKSARSAKPLTVGLFFDVLQGRGSSIGRQILERGRPAPAHAPHAETMYL